MVELTMILGSGAAGGAGEGGDSGALTQAEERARQTSGGATGASFDGGDGHWTWQSNTFPTSIKTQYEKPS
jgi:hypothetical protein